MRKTIYLLGCKNSDNLRIGLLKMNSPSFNFSIIDLAESKLNLFDYLKLFFALKSKRVVFFLSEAFFENEQGYTIIQFSLKKNYGLFITLDLEINLPSWFPKENLLYFPVPVSAQEIKDSFVRLFGAQNNSPFSGNSFS